MKSSVTAFAVLCFSCGSASPPPASAPSGPEEQASHAEPAAAAATAPAAAEKPAAADKPAAAEKPAAFRGTLFGKTFAARVACAVGTGSSGVAAVYVYDQEDFDVAGSCGFLPTVAGARQLSFRVEWKTGAKASFASYTFDAKKGAESEVIEFLGDKRYDRKWANRDFKPTGSVELLKAVNRAGDRGRVRISMANGDEKLAGEIDVYSTSDFY